MKDVTLTRALEAEKMFLTNKEARYIYDLRKKRDKVWDIIFPIVMRMDTEAKKLWWRYARQSLWENLKEEEPRDAIFALQTARRLVRENNCAETIKYYEGVIQAFQKARPMQKEQADNTINGNVGGSKLFFIGADGYLERVLSVFSLRKYFNKSIYPCWGKQKITACLSIIFLSKIRWHLGSSSRQDYYKALP